MENFNNIGQIKAYFEKLKEAHDVYVKVSNDKQIKIFEAFEWVFKGLESLGVDRDFSESLLVFGKDFLDSSKKKQLVEVALQTFSASGGSGSFSDLSSENELIEQAEKLFDSKAVETTPIKEREIKLAEKYGLRFWESLSVGDRVKIREL